MNKLKFLLRFFEKIEKLKTIKRALRVSDQSHQESPAEHSWRMAIMALLLAENLKIKIDIIKVLKMILIHDLGEITAGDVWFTKKNRKAEKTKFQQELQGAKKIFALLPSKQAKSWQKLWLEFANRQSVEAKFAYAIDKIEVIIQRGDLHYANWEKKDILAVILHWADEAVFDYPQFKHLWQMVQTRIKKQAQTKKRKMIK